MLSNRNESSDLWREISLEIFFSIEGGSIQSLRKASKIRRKKLSEWQEVVFWSETAFWLAGRNLSGSDPELQPSIEKTVNIQIMDDPPNNRELFSRQTMII